MLPLDIDRVVDEVEVAAALATAKETPNID